MAENDKFDIREMMNYIVSHEYDNEDEVLQVIAEFDRLSWHESNEKPKDYEKCVVEHEYTVNGIMGGSYAYTTCLWLDETKCFWKMGFDEDGFSPTILHEKVIRWRYIE